VPSGREPATQSEKVGARNAHDRLKAPASSQLVWRGTYRDEQPTGSDLGTGVLKGAKAPLNKYPKLRKP
jgi:hypothetical protein